MPRDLTACCPAAWRRDKRKVLDFYNDTRRQFRAAHIEPNAAHRALARLEKEYEGEVVIVIGKPCRNVSQAEAGDYIAGYTTLAQQPIHLH